MRWLARGEIDLPTHDRWLSEREREQVATLRYTKRRQEYLTRRWAAKHAVAAALGIDAGQPEQLVAIETRNHPSGAPFVAVDGRRADVSISLTDRAGWAVCLVGGTDALGIDLELVEPRSERFARDFFTASEQAALAETGAGEERDATANLVWSAKEAALKVLQTGLRADTRTVEVTIDRDVRPDGWAPLSVDERDGDRFHGWWRRDGRFVLTIATREPIEPPSAFRGSVDLAGATPIHSWVTQPLV